MRIPNTLGEFGFKAAIFGIGATTITEGWKVSDGYFFSLQEARDFYHKDFWEVKWPIEELDNGSIYSPDPSELE